jgi:hypothetical protein
VSRIRAWAALALRDLVYAAAIFGWSIARFTILVGATAPGWRATVTAWIVRPFTRSVSLQPAWDAGSLVSG